MIGKTKKIGKVQVLAFLWEHNLEIDSAYLPPEFFQQYEDVLELCKMIAVDWAKPTKNSQEIIDYVWNVFCEMRDLDPRDEYENIEAFFKIQEVAE
jgi:hypothetical protein